MARRRKSETTKVPVKQQPNVSAVRKSSRQRAKKQLDEQKVNGDITSSIENTDDSKDPNDNSQDSNKKVNAVPKKSSRYKNVGDKEKAATDSGNSQGGESDSQEAVDTNLAATEKVDSVDERQITASDSALNEIIWPEEDVIEETIICEEMEVETEMTGNYSIAQDGSVVVEQVVLVDDPNFVGKDVVEYTVIQNEDGTESMMVAPDNLENVSSVDDSYKNSNSYQMIEQGLSILHMSEPEITEPMQESENILSSENIVSPENIASSENIVSSENVISENIVNSENEKSNDASLCNADSSDNNKPDVDLSKKECRSLRSVTKNNISTRTRKTVNVSDKSVKKESDKRKKRTESSTKRTSSVENKSQKSENKEKSTKTKKTNTTEENVHRNSVASTQNITVITQEDDNSSSMSDKIEHQAISNVPTNDSLKDKIVNNSVISEQKNALSPTCTKSDNINRLSTKTKNSILGSEEHSRDSEVDGKMDSEDAKVSSSSENSNDTLLSSNSCKFSEFNTDNKISANQLNESDKKPGFRSRSGSTDTTGSESGSNSSGVRRSNRIRTIGLMKQRSRGRGVVTKPSVDAAKIPANQDRDKLISSTSPIQEKDTQQLKNNLDNVPETQSDKENSSYKTTTSQDIVTPLISTSGITGYDSDSNKPVKVKSRWRRSSELEMSNSASWSTSRPTLGFPNSAVTSNLVGIVQNSFTDTINKLPPLPEGLPQDLNVTENLQDSITKVSSQNVLDMNISTDTIAVTDNSLITDATTVIPKTIGAKISLPMVPVIGDREMEERLSQFEHLRENLYLTERFTSKETKRMVCDCFLTDEEIVRGELGCGEDCLNRLLMIECGSRCVNGDRCTNKRFQNCEYANCEVFRTEKKGFGLRATSNLFPGDFIMEYVGEVVDPRDFRKRAKEYSKDKNRHYYFMALKSDQIIDATMKGNISRFINHSCDPNAETQKWTVNGELRIGFFNKKFVAAGEEITFDYHFQRYGKEAQKCFCEAINCRGWIGDNPEDGKERDYVADMESTDEETEDEEDDKEDKENKEEKPEKQIKIRRKRVEKKKDNEHMEDEDLEEQIDKLCANGLKNRSHTLTLSRLMVRSREIQHRSRLLKVIRHGAQPCRRLFLDYHGLRLMWSYMMDVAGSTTEEAQQFRLEILRTLSTLPIPNRTMLLDSKVLSVVEKWSKQLYMSPNADSPEDDQSKLKSNNEETEMEKNEKTLECSKDNKGEEGKDVQVEIKNEIKTEAFEHTLISELATNLLVDWANLKEVFRIPKKERIEQMKEHEREADRGYKEDAEKEAKESTSYERPRSDRYNRNDSEKRSDRRRGRDSPDFEHNRVKDKRTLEERNLVQVPRMSKFERRQLFAMKVAKEEEERQRRQQEESWQQHQSQCLALGMDPFTTAAFDPQTGYPLFFNPQLAQWQAYPPPPIQVSESGELSQQCTQVYVGGAIPPPVYPSLPGTYGTPVLGQIHNGTPSVYVDKVPLESPAIATSVPARIPAPIPAPNPSPVLAPPPALDLPPKWKWARDKRGRIYYYHIKERISQWLPPPPDHIAVQPDSSTTSESSDESSSSNDEDEEPDEQLDQQSIQAMEVDQETDLAMQLPTVSVPEVKKRRDGLVQERIISPRREEDRVDHKKYKEIKEKLRRQKERAKLKEHFEKMRKHRRSSKSKTHVKHSTSKLPITSDMSPTTERKIKDTFRINMANVMVHFLNPYRKADCKQGRITNTDDFKHLARKLTHFVLAKELKHCKSVDELECNDNVKHKAKDFVRKYMNKFGAVYQKGTDED